MKAAALTGIRKLEVMEVPEPRIEAETDILLSVAWVGICGSDIHYFRTGRIGGQVVRYPFRVGHECTAVVEHVGDRVKRVKPGDRVFIDPAVSCGQCDQCLEGRPHTCRRLRFLGCPGQMEGCLSERLVMPESSCHPLDGRISLEAGVLLEPLSIGIHAVRLLDDPAAGSVGILGLGPIGLSVLLAVRSAGAAEVFATDKVAERLAAAENLGCAWTGNPDKSDVAAEVRARRPNGLDAVFECCGDPAALQQAVDILKPGGRLLILGIPEENSVSFDIHRLRREEIVIINVRRQNGCIPAATRILAEDMAGAGSMLTHRFGLEQIQEAFECVEAYRDGVLKAVVSPGNPVR